MKKKYCEYCGELLSQNCKCSLYAREQADKIIEDYENNPETHYGWHQQDIIDTQRRER